ncbi:MAG: sodium:proton antiporter [Clostridia bacterium]|nr:sodium:proton antiporter [Clostridia bacterium]
MKKTASSITLSAFVLILLGCIAAGVPILYALLAGYLLFTGYSLWCGFSLREVFAMSLRGIKTAKNILITFLLIGILTALWRAGGTIPTIVAYSVQAMEPRLFLAVTFLLNCLVSFLTGTSFGTAATMGTICMTVGMALSLNPVLMGGAILSGVYFGDRCSPVSTSALLVSELTKTNLHSNIRGMLKSAAVPLALSCLLYLGLGLLMKPAAGEIPDIRAMFLSEFRLGWPTLIPVAVILGLSLARVNVKLSMLAAILASIGVCLIFQRNSAAELLRFSVLGFTAKDSALAPMLNGGGIRSMLNVGGIVCISSCYSGIFEGTGLLDPVKKLIDGLCKKLSPYPVFLIVSFLSVMVACNQTLATMLTHQLCGESEESPYLTAMYLENSVIVVAGLIPWCIACNVPLTTVGAPMLSVCAAFYLPLILLCSLFLFRKKKKSAV